MSTWSRGDGELVACVPDLIMALGSDTAEPIPTESLRHGFRVAMVAMTCDPRWRTPEGLALAGPRAFGDNIEYVRCDDTHT